MLRVFDCKLLSEFTLLGLSECTLLGVFGCTMLKVCNYRLLFKYTLLGLSECTLLGVADFKVLSEYILATDCPPAFKVAILMLGKMVRVWKYPLEADRSCPYWLVSLRFAMGVRSSRGLIELTKTLKHEGCSMVDWVVSD
ncbi:hypothetical protein PanWU01x14_223620 [Parasponia andersonii]|uniref:Uncharacterized protein n=1 Tax=Parasponia andersonii TaxID=3476 RepID=A0A2P5BNQ0_PARAD|nr:hypothetical protein PanWU01x14_223620 [Parasponia andersonii]